MFYVSSRKNGKYGVTDTKDGVEEFYTKTEILDFVRNGIKIDGATIRDVFFGDKVTLSGDVNISRMASDTKMLKSKLVNRYMYEVTPKGALKRLIVDDNSTEYEIRLSDICNQLMDASLQNQAYCHIKLIFDDKISKVSKRAFSGMRVFTNGGVVVDLHEVTHFSLAEQIYVALATANSGYFALPFMPHTLIDIDDRFIKLQAACEVLLPNTYSILLKPEQVNFLTTEYRSKLMKCSFDIFEFDKTRLNFDYDMNDLENTITEISNVLGGKISFDKDTINNILKINNVDKAFYAFSVPRTRFYVLSKFFRNGGYDKELAEMFVNFATSMILRFDEIAEV